jgi:hypothetical protein
MGPPRQVDGKRERELTPARHVDPHEKPAGVPIPLIHREKEPTMPSRSSSRASPPASPGTGGDPDILDPEPRAEPMHAPLQASEIPNESLLRSIYGALLAYPNVAGCFVGRKRTEGVDREVFSIVCCVTEKVRETDLHPLERLPSLIPWPLGTQATAHVLVDVQVMLESGLHASPIAGSGDSVVGVAAPPGSASRPAAGTLGLVMNHPTYGSVVTTAAHVFGFPFGIRQAFTPAAAPRVWMRNGTGPNPTLPFEGAVVEVAWTPQSDYALVKPVGVPVQSVYQDKFPVGKAFTPDFFETGTVLHALTSQGLRPLRYAGARAVIALGSLPYERVHLAQMGPELLMGGDSGCALMDSSARPWGLHLGYVNLEKRLYSVFRAPSDDPGIHPSFLA